MSNQSESPRDKKPILKELIIIIPVCALAAHLFVSFRQKENLLEIILKEGYPLAFFVTFFIAFLMVMYVRYITKWLDRKHPWERNKLVRAFAQFFYSFALTLLFEFFMTAAYFAYFGGYHISQTVYFNSYLLLIIAFILIINLCYNLGYRNIPAVVTEFPVKDEKEEQESYHSDILAYNELNDVAYISISGKVPYAKNLSGELVLWHYNLTDSIAALPADNFYQATRSCILRRDIIDHLEPDPLKHKLTIVLKSPLNDKIRIATNNIEQFNKWWHYKL